MSQAMTPFALALLLAGCTDPAAADAAPHCASAERGQLLCGIASAEDLELASDGAHFFLSTTPGLSGVHHSRLRVMEIGSAKVLDLPIEIAAESGWGDKRCGTPPKAVGAHGIHLSRRADGREQLLVVNHEGREAVEFFEPQATSGGWTAVWRGCVENSHGSLFNDVTATEGGGFVVTAMFEAAAMQADPQLQRMLDGRNTGYLLGWKPGERLERLAESETAFPNGIQADPEGRGVWVAAWTGRQLRYYDLAAKLFTRSVALPFMPDNLSWGAEGRLLVAGIPEAGTFRRCFLGKEEFCSTPGQVAALEPGSAQLQLIHQAPAGELFGASVAVQVGADLYVGAFSGDRLLYLPGVFNSEGRIAGREE